MAGCWGRMLWVDLSRGMIEIRQLEQGVQRAYPGGGALGAWLLARNTRAHTDALSPDNLLVITTGPATGAAVSGASRCSVCALSPLTGAVGESQAGGNLGPMLKRAGLDALIIVGRAAQPVWLRVEDERAQLQDAAALRGRITVEVFDLLEKEAGPGAVVLQSGPAGEKLVRFACLLAGRNDVFGRTGLGAVFGSKNLRAITVRGTRSVAFADGEALGALARRGAERLAGASFPATLHRHGTPGVVGFQSQAGNLASYNHSRGWMEGCEKLTAESIEPLMGAGSATCFGCVVRCRRRVRLEREGISDTLGGPEFETLGLLGSNLGIADPVLVARANQLCGELGLDTITMGGLLGFVMECRERNYIDEKTLDGLDIRFGRSEGVEELIRRIGRREGIGDVLAEGFSAAVARFGPESARCAVHTKGQAYAVHLPQVKPSQALLYAASPIGPDHMSSEHDWLLEAGGDDALGLGILGEGDRASTGPAKIRMTVLSQHYYSLLDSLCLCMFCWGPGNLFRYEELVELVRAATGWGVTFHELMKAGERRIQLMRLLNARRGFGREHDRLAPRMFEPLGDGPSQGRRVDAEQFERMLTDYYEVLGCDPHTGHPTRGKLLELGLEWALDR